MRADLQVKWSLKTFLSKLKIKWLDIIYQNSSTSNLVQRNSYYYVIVGQDELKRSSAGWGRRPATINKKKVREEICTTFASVI
jgi:hypothetical protein